MLNYLGLPVQASTHAGEIDQMITRFFEAPAGPACPGPGDSTARGLGWRLLYPFLKHGRFPRWNREEAAVPAIEETCPLATKLFISHRWATPDDPRVTPVGRILRRLHLD